MSDLSSITSPKRQDEEILFRHFPGFTYSERVKETQAWIWDTEHGYDITKITNGTPQRFWVCRRCVSARKPKPPKYVEKGTTNMMDHLFRDHHISAPAGKAMGKAQKDAEAKKQPHEQKSGHISGTKQSGQTSISQHFGLDPFNQQDQAIANFYIKHFNKGEFHRLLVEWIVTNNKPFIEAEDPVLRRIFESLNPAVRIQQSHLSGDAIRSQILREYDTHVQTIIDALGKCPGLIHISFDGWTSPSRMGMYGLACFFRDDSGHPKKLILGVPELTNRHTGVNIAREVYQIITRFDITTKIGYAVLDNAEANDTAMEELGTLCELAPGAGRKRRGRCFGHTLNLSAKALLFGKHADAVDQEVNAGANAISDEAWRTWIKRGPVGKLHNIVYDVHLTQRLSWWLMEVQRKDEPSRRPLKVIRDNDTRWLSQLHMIRRAIKIRRYLDLAIIQYKAEWESENLTKTGNPKKGKKVPRVFLEEGRLTDHDWLALDRLADILSVYETVVRTLEGDGQIRGRRHGFEGSYGNIWDVILGFERVLGLLEQAKQNAAGFSHPEEFTIGIKLAWEKLDKYYCKLDETPIYYTALALHPGYSWDWFEEAWREKPEWITKAKAVVQDVWDRDYQAREILNFEVDNEPLVQGSSKRTFFNPFDHEARKVQRVEMMTRSQSERVKGDEYQAWCDDDTEKVVGYCADPFAYWHERRFKYPALSRMALDYLTIQPMSAECERLFSATRRMMTPQRLSLDAVIVGICQCLRSWHRSGFIHQLDMQLVSLAEQEMQARLEMEPDAVKRAEIAREWLKEPLEEYE